MTESFRAMFTVGGKTNSLGRSSEVLSLVLADELRMQELYECLFVDDVWVRMRAADTIEKVCREHPDWVEKYIDRFIADLSGSTQASIQWHLAQIYRQVPLTDSQKSQVILWFENLLLTTDVDWIVSANAMDTLVQFTLRDDFPKHAMTTLLKVQLAHHSKSVVKRANKLLATMEP